MEDPHAMVDGQAKADKQQVVDYAQKRGMVSPVWIHMPDLSPAIRPDIPTCSLNGSVMLIYLNAS